MLSMKYFCKKLLALDEIAKHDDMEVISEPYSWKFNENDDLW